MRDSHGPDFRARRKPSFSLLSVLLVAIPRQRGGFATDGVDCDGKDPHNGVDWQKARYMMWDVVERRELRSDFAAKLFDAQGKPTTCPLGLATATILLEAYAVSLRAEPLERHEDDALTQFLTLGTSAMEILSSGFPLFGSFAWLARETTGDTSEMPDGCRNDASRIFLAQLAYHLANSSSIPLLHALDYLGSDNSDESCPTGRAAALLALALPHALDARGPDAVDEVVDMLSKVETLLRLQGHGAVALDGAISFRGWPIWTLLHRIAHALSFVHPRARVDSTRGCLVMVYAFPTVEIDNDTAQSLTALEEYYFSHFNVRYPIVVFTDAKTAPTLEANFGRFTTAPIVPAVIPEDALTREVLSYSCVDGLDCVTGQAPSGAHRGVVNKTQYWSSDYLRISRYTAGPLFLHPALDTCGTILKVDTDFFFTEPLATDPIQEMAQDGARLGYWQIHLQGQRQEGYMDAAVAFLEARNLPILNRAFYARGRFEEKAATLGIPIEEVPEALQASTLIYGCLFAADVRLFREPLYREFFAFMDSQGGFEERGWSNQFFLGTTAAAFVFPSQVKRLYLSGRHQESVISVSNGQITETLQGSQCTVR